MGAPIIMAVRTPEKWVLLTPYHLGEHELTWRDRFLELHRVFLAPHHLKKQMGPLRRWKRSTWLPLSMLVAIRLSRRFAWWWGILGVVCIVVIAAKALCSDELHWVQLIALLLTSALCTALFFFTSWYRATFVGPTCTIELVVPFTAGPALHRFCLRVLECQERLAGVQPEEETPTTDLPPWRRKPHGVPPGGPPRQTRVRRTLKSARWA